MSNLPRFGPVYKTNNHLINDYKLKSSPVQMSLKKPGALHSPISHQSPTNKIPVPEIIHPNCQNQILKTAISNDPKLSCQTNASLPHRGISRSRSLSLGLPNSIPDLNPQETNIQNKKRTRKHRNSCSSDISWSPRLISASDDDRIRRKSDIYNDNQESPLCDQNY